MLTQEELLAKHLVDAKVSIIGTGAANVATNWPGVYAAGDVTHVAEQVLVHTGERTI